MPPAGRTSWRGRASVRGTATPPAAGSSQPVELSGSPGNCLTPQDPAPGDLTPESLSRRSSQASACEDRAELEVLNELLRRRQTTRSAQAEAFLLQGASSTVQEVSSPLQEDAPAAKRRSRWGNNVNTGGSKAQKRSIKAPAKVSPTGSAEKPKPSNKKEKQEKIEKPAVLADFHRLKSEFQDAKNLLKNLIDDPSTPSPAPCDDEISSPARGASAHSDKVSRGESPAKSLSSRSASPVWPGNVDDLWEPETQPDPYPQETPQDPDNVIIDSFSQTFGEQSMRQVSKDAETADYPELEKTTDSFEQELSTESALSIEHQHQSHVTKPSENVDRIRQDLELVEQQLAAAKSQADRIEQQRQALLERAVLEREPHFGPSTSAAGAEADVSASWAGLESEPSYSEYPQDNSLADPDLNAAALQIQAFYRGCRARSAITSGREHLSESWNVVSATAARLDDMLAIFGTEEPVDVSRLACSNAPTLALSQLPAARQSPAALQHCAAPHSCPAPQPYPAQQQSPPPQQSAIPGPAPKRKLAAKRASPAVGGATTARGSTSGPSTPQANTRRQGAEQQAPERHPSLQRPSLHNEPAGVEHGMSEHRPTIPHPSTGGARFGVEPSSLEPHSAPCREPGAVMQDTAHGALPSKPPRGARPSQAFSNHATPSHAIHAPCYEPHAVVQDTDHSSEHRISPASCYTDPQPVVESKLQLLKRRKPSAQTASTAQPALPAPRAQPQPAPPALQPQPAQPAQDPFASGTHVYPRARKFAAAGSAQPEKAAEEVPASVVYPRARRSAAGFDAHPRARKASTGSTNTPVSDIQMHDQATNAAPKVLPKKQARKSLNRCSSAPVGNTPASTPSMISESYSQMDNMEDTGMMTPRSSVPTPQACPKYRPSFRALQDYLPTPSDAPAARGVDPSPEPPPVPSRTPPPPEPPPAPTRTPPRASLRTPPKTPPRKASQAQGSTRPGSRVKVKKPESPDDRPDEPPPPPWSSGKNVMASSDEETAYEDVRDRKPAGPPQAVHKAPVMHNARRSVGSGPTRSRAQTRQTKPPDPEVELTSEEEPVVVKYPVKGNLKMNGNKAKQRRPEKVSSHKAEPVRAESVSSTTVSESEAALPPRERNCKKHAAPADSGIGSQRGSNLSGPSRDLAESRRESNLSGNAREAGQHRRGSNMSGPAKGPAKGPGSSALATQQDGADSRRGSKASHPARGSTSSNGNRQTTAGKPQASEVPAASDDLAFPGATGVPDGQVYMGFRNKDGGREGFGVERRKDGEIYTGQWQGGKKNGHGTLFFEGGVFEGQWVDNNAHGHGTISHKNGDIFKGDYKNNKKCGPGVYTWKDGSEEKGDYIDGQRHGWHSLSRDGEHWDILYEQGNMISMNKQGSVMAPRPEAHAQVTAGSESLAEKPRPSTPVPTAVHAPPGGQPASAANVASNADSSPRTLAGAPNSSGLSAKAKSRGAVPAGAVPAGRSSVAPCQRAGLQKSGSGLRTNGKSLVGGGPRSNSRSSLQGSALS